MVNRLFFNGTSTSTAQPSLWISDGTAAGSSELTISGANVNGINPTYLVSFNNQLYFNGIDAASHRVLWTSDGTGAGTTALTVSGAGTYFNPKYLTLAGGKLYFSGNDTSENGLWVSDGTAAGTRELVIAGSNTSYGFDVAQLTSFGGKLYFEGTRSDGHYGLWVTDGTDSGSSELMVSGASTSDGVYPGYLTVFNGKLYFQGEDTTNNFYLWKSDGTAAGTSKLTIAGANANGLLPRYMTAVGNKLFFSGVDTSGQTGLWVSDGTAAGTSELTVAGASSLGLVPTNLWSFGGKLYFSGKDSSDQFGLWVSDGTAGGTTRLVPADADAGGLDPTSLFMFNGSLYFSGHGPSNAIDLWSSDGTQANTAPVIPNGIPGNGLAPHDFAALVVPVPVATGLTLAPASDSGIQGDHVTLDTTPTITGTGNPGNTITLYDNGGFTPVGSVVVDQDGTWSITTTALSSGSHSLTATQTDPNTYVSDASAALLLTIDSTEAPPISLSLATASDSGTLGDGVTNVTRPVINGLGIPGDTVTLYEGTTVIGTSIVGESGHWAITTTTLSSGVHSLTGIQTDAAGNVSEVSAPLALTITALSAALAANPHNGNGIVYNDLLNGEADPNTVVSITDNGVIVGTAQADANGVWTFDLAGLGTGAHALTASETDTGGHVSTTDVIPLTVLPHVVADTRFSLATGSAHTTGSFFGSDYTGSAGSYLQAEYGYTGTDNVFVIANVANVFIYGGTGGQDVLLAKAGSNVLDARSGSNWMVGATGEDGGKDVFFVDNHSGETAWSTLLNFHVGDMLTLWNYIPGAGNFQFADNMGADGYQGATLQTTLGDGSGGVDLVTFQGLSLAGAQFATSTGVAGDLGYLAVTRIA